MCMLMSHQQNAELEHNIMISNRCFESVAKFKHLGMIVTNQNLINPEIKSKLNSDKVCYHSVQKFFVSLSAV
jgi:hypothetical protein